MADFEGTKLVAQRQAFGQGDFAAMLLTPAEKIPSASGDNCYFYP
jgi:hypothetical protein